MNRCNVCLYNPASYVIFGMCCILCTGLHISYKCDLLQHKSCQAFKQMCTGYEELMLSRAGSDPDTDILDGVQDSQVTITRGITGVAPFSWLPF